MNTLGASEQLEGFMAIKELQWLRSPAYEVKNLCLWLAEWLRTHPRLR